MSSSPSSSWRERRKKLRLARRGNDEGEGNEDESNSENFFGGGFVRDNGRSRGDEGGGTPHMSAAKRFRIERNAALRGGPILALDPAPSLSMEADEDTRDDKMARGKANENTEGEEGDGGENDSQEKTQDQKSKQPASLLEHAARLRRDLTIEDRADLARKEEETRILRESSKIQANALQAASEVADGVTYETSMPSTWRCPRLVLAKGEEDWTNTRKNWHVLVEGDDIPPPLKSFAGMKLPPRIMDLLNERNIKRPTPIQMQGLPVALAGRDMVGIAFTGSGKTMSFSLPLVMAALEEEMNMPLIPGEGPVGIVLAPSRELVRQTYEIVCDLCDALARPREGGMPPVQLRSQLIIGGEDSREQLAPFREKGVHCVVATPGRLKDFLKKGMITLNVCRYICLDEADRMLDLGFDEEVGEIMNHFNHQRQTVLYSATFPAKFQDFAQKTLVRPVVVNVGRAGAANLDVIQEVEYVKQEAKIVYLLECLQKTAPPVIIFCERKGDVDDIHEYLLLKGVDAVGIHGGKDQEERNEAIRSYKAGENDVLVATDIAAKGLDFADIQHVINFDMPPEIENYVHRIGRTGRCGKTGVATTFINKSCEEMTLLDLKHILKEAKQRIPPVLMIMDDPQEMENGAEGDGTVSKGCAFCGGLGHTIVDCPKIDKDARRVTQKDALASGDGYGGDW